MRSALRLVWLLDVRHLAAHRARLALAAFGIAAGVALAVTVSALGSSIGASLESVASAAASEANLEVRPTTGAGLSPALLDELSALEGIEAAGAVVESYTRLRNGERSVRVLLLGVDQGILDLAPEAVDTRSFRTADPFGLMLPPGVADQLGAAVGDRVQVATPQGWRPVGVGAVLPPESAERARVVVGTIGVVQDVLGRGASYDAIYLEATDPRTALARVQEAAGTAGRAGPIAFRQQQVRQMLDATVSSFNAASIVALFVGAFLVYNTMAMTAVERIGEAGILRAVGARRRQVFGLFVAEGGLLGLVGSAVGIGGGILLARVILTRRGGPLEDIFPIEITALAFSPGRLAVAGVAGVLAAIGAAYLPARRVARSDPAVALGPAGALEDPTERPRPLTTVLGAVLAVGGSVYAGWAFAQDTSAGALAAMVVALAGVALLIRTGVPFIARLAYGRMLRSSRVAGLTRLATGEVLRSPGRTAFTTGAVLLALSLVIGFGITQASFARNFAVEFDQLLRGDLYVRSATWRPFGSDIPLHAGLASQLEKVPGVAVAYPFKVVTTTVEDQAVVILTWDMDAYARLPGLSEDRRRDALGYARLTREPGSVLVSSSATIGLGLEPGDTVTVPTPAGEERLRVTGVYPDPAAVTPEILMDYEHFSALWQSEGADSFPIGLEAGADAEAVRERIVERFGPRYGLEVDTRQEYQDRLNSLVQGTLGLISSVQLVAMIVAGLGLANTLLISTLERRRDLGVLRAVGMLRRQLRRMVTAEALMIGGLGVVLAWGFGTLVGLGLHGVTEASLGTDIRLLFPPWVYGGAAVLGLAAAGLAALYPAHRAASVDVVEALHYE